MQTQEDAAALNWVEDESDDEGTECAEEGAGEGAVHGVPHDLVEERILGEEDVVVETDKG